MKMTLSICFTFIIIACGSAKIAGAQKAFAQYGKEEQLTDSFLHALQRQNDIVIATAIENNSFAKTITYQILAMKNGGWKGYKYVNSSRSPGLRVNEMNVPKAAGDSLILFLKQIEVWKIKNDEGRTTCNAVINDGSTWHLFIIMPTRVIESSFYEPEFYQQNCSNANRKLFLDAINKIRQVFVQ